MDCGALEQIESHQSEICIGPVSDEEFLQQFLEANHCAGIEQCVSSDVVFVAISTKLSKSRRRALKASNAKVSEEASENPVLECGLAMLDSRYLHSKLSEKRIRNLISTRYFSVYNEFGRSPKPGPCEFAETEFVPSSNLRGILHDCLRIRDSSSADPNALREIVIANTSLKNPAFMYLGGEHVFNISRTIDITALARNTLQVEPKQTFAHLLTELRVTHKEEELANCGNLATFMMHAMLILAIRSASRNKSLSEIGKTKLEILKTFGKTMITERGLENPSTSIPTQEGGSDAPVSSEFEFSNPSEIENDGDISDASEIAIDYRERSNLVPKVPTVRTAIDQAPVPERPTSIPNVASVRAGENKIPISEWRKFIPRTPTFGSTASVRHSLDGAKIDGPNNADDPQMVPPPPNNVAGMAVARVTAPVKPVPQSASQKESLNIQLAYILDAGATTPVAPASPRDTISKGGSRTPADCTVATAETFLPVRKPENITSTDYWKGLQKLDESEDEEDGGVSIYERRSPSP